MLRSLIFDLCFGVVAVNIKCLQDCLLCLCNGMIQSVYIIAIMTGGIGPGNKPKKEEELTEKYYTPFWQSTIVIRWLQCKKQNIIQPESSVPLFRRRCSKNNETGVPWNRNSHIQLTNTLIYQIFLKLWYYRDVKKGVPNSVTSQRVCKNDLHYPGKISGRSFYLQYIIQSKQKYMFLIKTYVLHGLLCYLTIQKEIHICRKSNASLTCS